MEEMTLPQAIDHLKEIQKTLLRVSDPKIFPFKRKTIKAIDRILEEIELTRDDGK